MKGLRSLAILFCVFLFLGGASLLIIGILETSQPVPTVPSCNGDLMSPGDVCQVTDETNGMITSSQSYTYDQELALEQSVHHNAFTRVLWGLGLLVVFTALVVWIVRTRPVRTRP